MDELIDKVMQGVDPMDPGASWTILTRLMALTPWWSLLAWTVFFVLVGALLGWWRGRLKVGIVAALILGPFGWVVPFLPVRRKPGVPPPLPSARPSKRR
ncbi:hypothetical protein EC912_103224 [Luteibacter rhizovicinus]|uniref:Uncharacterized protein n=1 Tax=Luteibacter rhizovicinus TaxID=242606 RepID=A0A4V2W468_9GAMM|nr:hypothetical protein [Luteibacter rhizovicinus]TCV94739.1 hypothetical protein EC912_103224 [Luteibacter rhizovicinus]